MRVLIPLLALLAVGCSKAEEPAAATPPATNSASTAPPATGGNSAPNTAALNENGSMGGAAIKPNEAGPN